MCITMNGIYFMVPTLLSSRSLLWSFALHSSGLHWGRGKLLTQIFAVGRVLSKMVRKAIKIQ